MKLTTIERAVAALRGGRSVRIEGDRSITIFAVETASDAMLELADPHSRAPMLISGERAAALSLANMKNAADLARPVLLARSEWLDGATGRVIADPGFDLDRAPSGPLSAADMDFPEASHAALVLARLAGLLPAVWVIEDDAVSATIRADEILAARPEVALVSRARLPLDGLPEAQIVAFRGLDDGEEHVALLVGAFGGKPPLVRLHSECLTGDVFGSLKCDCGPQLCEALRIVGAEGSGILLYLRQEGRGIGLANKVRAYALQDRGLDTVDANRRLGFADDERDYGHAAAMLRALGIDEVRLLTNNPAKVAGLEDAGISVVERVPHNMPTNPHNADYIAAKRTKSGHFA